MGKVTGFLEYERLEEGYEPVPAAGEDLEGIRHRPERRAGQGPGRALHGLRHAVLQQRLPGQQHHSGLQRPRLPRRLEAARSRCCTRPTTSPSSPAASAPRPARRPARSTSTTTRWASSASSTPSSTAPGPKAGSSRSRRQRRPARRWPWSAAARPGLAAAQQLARAGHEVTVFEKNSRIGGLLRYGIPDFKMEKTHIDRRIDADAGRRRGLPHRRAGRRDARRTARSPTTPRKTISAEQLKAEFDAVLLTGGAETSRDLPVPGRDLDGVHFAMEFLPQQNKVVRRRQAQGPDQGHRQARHRHRRRRHRQRLRRHQQPPRRGQRDAVRADADAAGGGEQAADLALLAAQAAHQLQPRRGLRARVRHRHQGVHRHARAS